MFLDTTGIPMTMMTTMMMRDTLIGENFNYLDLI